jgi:hypothetical protein
MSLLLLFGGSIPAIVSVTGVESTGAVGTLEAANEKITTLQSWLGLSGVPHREQFGTTSVAGSADLTGVAGTGAAGDFTVTGVGQTDVTGVAGTGAAGTIDAQEQQALLTGVAGTGAAGDTTVTVTVSVALTGVESATAVNVPEVNNDEQGALTGVEATGSAGDVAGIAGTQVTLTGVAATAAAGDFSVTGVGNTDVTGVAGTGEPGTVSVVPQANVSLTGVEGTGSVGDFTVTGIGNVSVDGIAATSGVGDVQTEDVVTGVESVTALGSLEVYLGIPSPLEAIGNASITAVGGIVVAIHRRQRISITAVSPSRRAITAEMDDRRKSAA